MASPGSHTLAVAGITATALVGIAGSAAGWLSARDDRASQRALAHDDRVYTERSSAYLAAISFVESQKNALKLYRRAPRALTSIRYEYRTPVTLQARLHAFGSPEANQAFDDAERASRSVFSWVETKAETPSGVYMLAPHPSTIPNPNLIGSYDRFEAKVERFERLVHGEVG
jgi:hypothetical protein